MPDIVVDRSLVLPAVCSAKSRYRALLALLKYGRVSLFARSGADEKQLTEEYAGAEFGGPTIDKLVSAAQDAKVGMDEQIGHAPDHWRMIGSRLLFDSYQRTIRDYHHKFGLDLTAEEVAALRQKLVLTASGFVPDGDLVPIIPYTDRRETDIAIHTTLIGGADLLVTGDERLIGTTQTHPDTSEVVRAVSWDEIVNEISTSSFELAQVYPQLW